MLAFISARDDANLWSVAVDASSGVARGPLQRLTRGPGILVCLSATRDFRTLVLLVRPDSAKAISSRETARTGSETTLSAGPSGGKVVSRRFAERQPARVWHARARQLSEQRVPSSSRILSEGTWRTLGDDCGGRPREWVDERLLIIERFGRLEHDRRHRHAHRRSSASSCRARSDRSRTLACRPTGGGSRSKRRVRGRRPTYSSPGSATKQIPESDWVLVDRSASHPFWSADGGILYYTPIGMNPTIRSAIRARRFAADSVWSRRRAHRGLFVRRDGHAGVSTGHRARRHA